RGGDESDEVLDVRRMLQPGNRADSTNRRQQWPSTIRPNPCGNATWPEFSIFFWLRSPSATCYSSSSAVPCIRQSSSLTGPPSRKSSAWGQFLPWSWFCSSSPTSSCLGAPEERCSSACSG